MTVELKEGWEERYEQIKQLPVKVTIEIPGIEDIIISSDEIFRAEEVLALVSKGVGDSVHSMLKGVVKYVDGRHTVREWIELMIDEARDLNNYGPLLMDAYDREEAATVHIAHDIKIGHSNEAIRARLLNDPHYIPFKPVDGMSPQTSKSGRPGDGRTVTVFGK